MKTALLAFTQTGARLADRIAAMERIGPDVARHESSQMSARDFVAAQFKQCELLIFIGAAAIAVRLIAPWLKDKAHDPAVLVIDELGQFVIPILSGHLGGANELASHLAQALQAQAVITTATDLHRCFAIDVWSRKNRCLVLDISRIKAVSSRLLAGQTVGLCSDWPLEGCLPGLLADCSQEQLAERGARQPEVGIWISCSVVAMPFATTLQVVPRVLALGAGCRRGTAPAAFEQFVLDLLTEKNLHLDAIACVASIDIKQDEPCLVAFCKKYQLPLVVYSAKELSDVEGEFMTSDFVRQTTGVDNVSERSAVRASQGGDLLVPRHSRSGMTLALAAENWQGVF